MPSFRFTARDNAGRTQSGVVASANAMSLAGELRQRGLLVLDVQPDTEGSARTFSLNPFDYLPPTSFDVQIGLQQLASMLRAGLTLLSSLKTVAEQARRPRMAAIWRDVYEQIEEGASFSDALASHKRRFPVYIVQLVKVGEQSGSLETVLTRGAEHLERSRDLRMTLINAMIYPAIVVVMALGVATFLLVSVIPKIQKFLVGRGRRLPAITQALLDISQFVANYLVYISIGVVALGVAITLIYMWPPGRRAIDTMLLRVPIFGGIFRLAGTAVFSRGLSILLESGVTLLEGLRTVEQLVSNKAQSARIESVRTAVLQGGTLAESLNAGREFLPMLGRMAAVGEQTGTLDPVLAEVARFHEQQLQATVRRFSTLIEPVIIVVVGGMVGFVYIAFFVALFSLAGG